MDARSGTAATGERPAVRVLLLDPDPLSREYTREALARRPGLVVELPHGRTHPPPSAHQVVLLAETPDTTERVERIRALVRAGHRVVVHGASWTGDSIRLALESGASGCIRKSLDFEGLVAALGAAVAGHIVVSPDLLPTYPGSGAEGEQAGPAVASPRAVELLDALTDRELEILGLLGEGLATKEIASQLYVSLATVKSHVSHAMAKLRVRNRVQAVLLVKELRLMELARTHERGSR